MSELLLFSYAFLLGLLFNAMPGAILIESLRRGLKGGFRPAFAVQIGSLAGDGLWVILGVAGAASIILIPYAVVPLMVGGTALIGWLALQSLRDSRAPMPEVRPATARESRGGLLAGIALSVANPLNIVYWAALGGTIAAITQSHPRPVDLAIFIGGFMASSVLWCFFAAWLIGIVHHRMTQVWWSRLHILCGLGLLLVMVSLCVSILEQISGKVAY